MIDPLIQMCRLAGMPKDPPGKSPKGVFESGDTRDARALRELRDRRSRSTSGEIMLPTRAPPMESDGEPTPPPVSVPNTVHILWNETREDVKELQQIAHSHGNRLIALSGEDGTNGKVGNLQKGHAGIIARLWWFVGILIGGLGGMAYKAVTVVRAYDALETKAERAAATAERNTEMIQGLNTANAQLSAQVQTLQNLVLTRRRGGAVDQPDYPDRMNP